jgi:squalene-associated FAD-dependent desaturase
MRCCTNLADFCRRVGIGDLFRREPEVTFLGPRGRISTLRAGGLPAPFHLAGSFLRASYLGWAEKFRVGYGLACLALDPGPSAGGSIESFADWLRRHRQTPRTMELFWSTVLVSALNERLDRMDVGHARKVFVDGFLATKHGFEMELPLVPLGELYGSRLEQWLNGQDVSVRSTTGVSRLDVDDEGALRGLILRSGEAVASDFVVVAVPFDRVASLLDVVAGRIPNLEQIGQLESSPITGVHLWFDRTVCPHDHAVLPGRLVQWVFNHTALQGRTAGGFEGGQYLQVVISASYDLLGKGRDEIRDAVLTDLSDVWPAVKEARLVRSWVVTEHGATFAVRPGVDALRPSQRTTVDGLFLAGDWTDTGWPATMEGAVRSGYAAAQGILADLQRPERILRRDLEPDPLARWLLPRPVSQPPWMPISSLH